MIGACRLPLSWWEILAMTVLVVMFTAIQMTAVIESYGRAQDDYERSREGRVALAIVILNGLLVALAWLGARGYYCG